MNAKKCDRCGKYYDEYEKEIPEEMLRKNEQGLTRVNHVGLMGSADIGYSIAVSKPIDICPECMDKMIDFLKGKPDISNINMSVIAPVEDMKYAMPLIESIPKDMRDRVYSIEQSADGDITMYLDIYFQNEDNKNE